jgi:hypothetical protein
MIIGEGLPFIQNYVETLNEAIKTHSPESELTRLQRYWLSFVILGLLITNTLCWARFERFSGGNYGQAAICWMFKKAKVAWDMLLCASVTKIVERYTIQSGILVIDDTDSERSKHTTQIAKVHKIRDKKHGGFFSGQNIIFLLLVTDSLSIPVGFSFYEPDPAISEWKKEDQRLRKKGVAKQFRPQKPERDAHYPTKVTLGLALLRDFVKNFPAIGIKATLADALYGNPEFLTGAQAITNQAQVISQIKKTQLINVNGKFIPVHKFFENYSGKMQEVRLRHTAKLITYRSAKFKVKSHDKRLHVIALKYENESDYRYLIASDTTWLDVDVIKAYALRWLVEVFIQDWKTHEGWEQLAMQRGMDGSERGVIISLLSDHALHFHEQQLALYKNKEPAATVGSLREKVMVESLTAFIETIVTSDDPKAMFEAYSSKIAELFQLKSSIRHMRGLDMEKFAPMNP